MEEQDTSFEGQVNAGDVAAVAPEKTVADVATLSLEELNQHLGKNFPDRDTALKSLKDTFSYVGKKKEDIAKEIGVETKLSSVEQELAKLRKDMWFKDNPDHAPYRAIIEKMGNPQDVINSEEYKQIFSKAKGYDDLQSKRTVLESNPRIAASRDTMAKASEALQKGKTSEGGQLVAQAVREAFKF